MAVTARTTKQKVLSAPRFDFGTVQLDSDGTYQFYCPFHTIYAGFAQHKSGNLHASEIRVSWSGKTVTLTDPVGSPHNDAWVSYMIVGV